MKPIKLIDKDGLIIAAHTTEHPRSSYGTQIWCIYIETPSAGPATWRQGDKEITIEIINLVEGWLVCRQPDGYLCGIIWSDGSYYSDMLIDSEDCQVQEYQDGLHVRGTVPMGKLGCILNV